MAMAEAMDIDAGDSTTRMLLQQAQGSKRSRSEAQGGARAPPLPKKKRKGSGRAGRRNQRKGCRMTTVRLGLQTLLGNGAHGPIFRGLLKDDARRVQQIAFSGSRLLNFVVLHQLDAGVNPFALTRAPGDDTTPLQNQQTFIRHCFAAVVTGTHNTRIKEIYYDEFAALLGIQEPVDGAHLSHHITNLAAQYMVNMRNLYLTTLRPRLEQGIQLGIALIRIQEELDLDNRSDGRVSAQLAGVLLAGGDWSEAITHTPLPEVVQLNLVPLLENLRDALAGPVATTDQAQERAHPTWTAYKHIWTLHQIQKARENSAEGLAQIVTEEVRRRLPRRLLRAMSILPLCSPSVPCIKLTPTTILVYSRRLAALLPPGQWAGIEDLVEEEQRFLRLFPGLERQQFWRTKTGHGWVFDSHISTDGFRASVLFRRPPQDSDPPADARQYRPSTGRSWVVEGVDNNARTAPVQPTEGQRVVAIDPGRRSMAVAVAGNFAGYAVGPGEIPRPVLENQEIVKLHTNEHETKSCRKRAWQRTRRHLKKTMVDVVDEDGTTRRVSVAEYQSSPQGFLSPKVSSFQGYRAYLEGLRPILDAWLRVHRIGNVQRGKLDVIRHIDKSLDKFCRRLIGPGSAHGQPVLVAYGNGYHVCSHGFGYTSAPQQRLRRRLEWVHGAQVTVINEAYTSQKCCWCHGQLADVHRTSTNANNESRRHHVHAVKRCTTCTIEDKPWAPKFWNRDVNAAWNILHIYLALGGPLRTRPLAFTQAGQQPA
uniref:Cas12f1-like TNB domain-containing protein n=1 Tax=Rhizochromulina marina TaxID=1034831 RepID=A0A7S2SHY2_9STRA|mmetsp:Transcript_30560/g.88773  ORF Transcript_30560/g.88773 Transcript_30560/m.88773 type:complete len:762 (+) Transcript_30560:1878-4163(+)